VIAWKQPFRPLNTFSIGTIVDINNIENMQGLRINAINDSGVTVTGLIGNQVVLSGQSPAKHHEGTR